MFKNWVARLSVMSSRYAPQISKSKLKLITARSRFMTGSILMTAFMLLTVLNGLLAGKFGDDEAELYSPVAHWPWIPLPAWLVIAVALLAPISVATMLRHLTWEELPQLAYLVMMTLVTYTGLPALFSVLYRDSSGLPIISDSDVWGGAGWHWIAAVIQVLTLSMLLFRALFLWAQELLTSSAQESPVTGEGVSDRG